jgi:putative Mn2+ efflux pump MntP
MELVSLLALAVGLSMDATAVAATRALVAERAGWREAATTAVWFGGFQAAMPLVGWWIGERIGPFVGAWDHWIAFVLLAGIGGKMLHDVWRGGEDDAARVGADPFGARTMLPLAVATSIDALAAGITLPTIGAPIAISLVTIGVTTALFSFVAVLVGRRLGSAAGKRLDVLGGVVLIGLGVKILVEHLLAEG